MLPDVYSYAKTAAVKAIIGDPPRCYRHGDAPQKVTAPYITWLSDAIPENHLDGTPPTDEVTVDISCWSDDDEQVVALAETLRNAIEADHHCTFYGVSPRDPETRRYRIVLTFTFWVDRPAIGE